MMRIAAALGSGGKGIPFQRGNNDPIPSLSNISLPHGPWTLLPIVIAIQATALSGSQKPIIVPHQTSQICYYYNLETVVMTDQLIWLWDPRHHTGHVLTIATLPAIVTH